MLGFFVRVLRLRRPLAVFFALVRSIQRFSGGLTAVGAFRRPCDGASGLSDPANSSRLKTNTFAPAPTPCTSASRPAPRRTSSRRAFASLVASSRDPPFAVPAPARLRPLSLLLLQSLPHRGRVAPRQVQRLAAAQPLVLSSSTPPTTVTMTGRGPLSRTIALVSRVTGRRDFVTTASTPRPL